MASASYLRLTKSETRELSDREYYARRMGQPTEWEVANKSLFTAFVICAGIIALIALLVR